MAGERRHVPLASAVVMLEPVGADVPVPSGYAPVGPLRAAASDAARVRVGDSDESLVPVPPVFGPLVPYESLPLPRRGRLRLRQSVVGRLLAASARLPDGFGLAVLDGWRSLDFQVALLSYYESLQPDLPRGYVADPSDADLLAGHTTGGAVDLTLTWAGRPLALGTDYDSFEPTAHPGALERQNDGVKERDLRRMLTAVLRAEGFAPYPLEWWLWSYGDQWWAADKGLTHSLFGVATG